MENEPEQHTPTLSVTVLNYNYAHYLPQCLDSILSQTWKDFELILINDRSTDNSLEVIQPYLADSRIKFVNHEENKGFVASLIEGSSLSRGKYMTVISADDYCVSPNAFSILLEPLEADDSVVLSYSAFGLYDANSKCTDIARPHQHSFVRSGLEEFTDLVEAKYFILHSGTIIRTSAYYAAGGYDTSLRYSVDTILFLLLCAQGKFAYSENELYGYRMHGTNMSRSFVGFRQGIVETIGGVRQAIAVISTTYAVHEDRYRYALQRHLLSTATGTIFGGNYRCGWYAYWRALRLQPIVTLFQLRTLSLIVRTLVGSRYFADLRSAFRPLLRSSRSATSAA